MSPSSNTYESRVLEAGLEAVGSFDELHLVLVFVHDQDGAGVLFPLGQRFDDCDVKSNFSLKVIDQPAKKKKKKVN